MRIGILSDTHGRKDRLQRALELLSERGAEAMVHCGDIGSVECLGVLAGADAPTYAVAGNTDRHVERLSKEATRSGVSFHWEVVEVPLGDSRFLVATHGHDEEILAELVQGEQFPYVCHGHTHRFEDERVGSVRVICPGALRHPRHPRHPTVALLDTETDVLERIDVAS
jgi:uncharacterized protein